MAEANRMMALLDASKQFPGTALAPGSKIVFKDPASREKITFEKPKDGIVKRIRKTFTKQGKSAPPAMAPGPRAYRAENEESDYLECSDPPQEQMPPFANTESCDRQIYMNFPPNRGIGQEPPALPACRDLPPILPRLSQSISEGYAFADGGADDCYGLAICTTDAAAPLSPETNTKDDSERQSSLGKEMDAVYQLLGQDNEKVKRESQSPKTGQKGEPLPNLNSDVISQALVPDYW